MNFDFLRDDSPYSTMRVGVMFTLVLFVPIFVAAFAYAAFSNRAIPDIPDSVNWLLGVVLGGKSAQKAIEIVGDILRKRNGNGNHTGGSVSGDSGNPPVQAN